MCHIAQSTLAAYIFLISSPAFANPAQVWPTSVHLDQHERSSVIQVFNDGPSPIDVEVEVYTWTQSEDDPMILGPTDEPLAFPRRLRIEAGGEAHLRLGTSNPSTEVERAYRVFLGSSVVDARGRERGRVRWTSLPVYVEPWEPRPHLRLGLADVSPTRLVLDLANVGNAHAEIQEVMAIGRNAAGEGWLLEDERGWILLRSSQRPFDVPLLPEECAELTAVEIDVWTNEGVWTRTLPVDPDDCTP